VCVLGETNIAMREELDGLLRKQYETATKNLRSTVQQLTSSQQIIQVALNKLVITWLIAKIISTCKRI